MNEGRRGETLKYSGAPGDERFALDDFRCWIDGDSIQIKAVTSHGDPVDLGTGEVRAIIVALSAMVERIDGH